MTLDEFKLRETEYIKNMRPTDGYLIRPERVLKTNARFATLAMKHVNSSNKRKKDANLVMIPWLRAAIDAARDYMRIETIRDITGMSADEFSRFLYSANSLSHACSDVTLKHASPPMM